MCTLEKHGEIFYLTLTGSDEHRLSPTLIASVLSALAEAASQSTRGSVLVTTSTGKFFSNGFDLGWTQSAGSPAEAQRRLHQMVEEFKPVVAALISLPMPTIAAVQGHAAAAGLMLVLSHDYVVMRSDRGVLYMSEVDIGLTLPDYFSAVVRTKVGSAAARREVLLRGRKVRGEEAVAMGIVEEAHEGEEAVAWASRRLGDELARRRWDGEVYAEIRKGLYPELCGVLGLTTKVVATPRL